MTWYHMYASFVENKCYKRNYKHPASYTAITRKFTYIQIGRHINEETVMSLLWEYIYCRVLYFLIS